MLLGINEVILASSSRPLISGLLGLLNFIAQDQVDPISPITDWKLICLHANEEMNESLISLIKTWQKVKNMRHVLPIMLHVFSSINCTGAESISWPIWKGSSCKLILSLQGNKVCFSSFYSLAIIKSWLWRKSCVSEFDCNWKIFKYA